ncbi:MAG: hypothetical protein ACJAYU_001242 [Bradymonadia bacterium]|jgi:hypothetical protein
MSARPEPILPSWERASLPGSAIHLAIVRIVFGAYMMKVFLSPVYPLLAQLGGRLPTARSLLPIGVEQIVAANLFEFTLVAAVAALLMCIGLFTRVMSVIVFVLFLLTQAVYWRGTLFHDDWVYFTAILLILALAPTGDALSMDSLLKRRRRARDSRDYRWPIELCVSWFGAVYVFAGLAKMFPLHKGFTSWLTGERIQEFARDFVLDSPWVWMTGHTIISYDALWFFAFAALATVIVEIGAISIIVTDRLRWLLLGSILAFHVGIWWMGVPNFIITASVGLVLFFRPWWFSDYGVFEGEAEVDPEPNG